MWARTTEVLLGCWLAMSPFIFGHLPEPPAWWINDFACALLMMTFGVLSFWHPTRHAHLLQIAVGFWMLGFAYYQRFWGVPEYQHAPAALQNLAAVGFLLLMFAILPNDATRPPSSWEQFRAPERLRSADHLAPTASDYPGPAEAEEAGGQKRFDPS
jgi:hypothetical protein